MGSLRKNILFECHDVFYSGHMGITKTLKHVETNLWWPKFGDDVKTYVNTCPVCQHSKNLYYKNCMIINDLKF